MTAHDVTILAAVAMAAVGLMAAMRRGEQRRCHGR